MMFGLAGSIFAEAARLVGSGRFGAYLLSCQTVSAWKNISRHCSPAGEQPLAAARSRPRRNEAGIEAHVYSLFGGVSRHVCLRKLLKLKFPHVLFVGVRCSRDNSSSKFRLRRPTSDRRRSDADDLPRLS